MCFIQGALLKDRWQPGWEGSLGENGYVYMSGWVPFCPPETITALLISCVCLVAQSCLTLCKAMDCSPPGASVHGISQIRILDWVPINQLYSNLSFFQGTHQKKGYKEGSRWRVRWRDTQAEVRKGPKYTSSVPSHSPLLLRSRGAPPSRHGAVLTCWDQLWTP